MEKSSNKIIKGCGVHHIALRAYDFEKTVKFYTDGLGFTKSISWGEGDKRIIMLDPGDGNFLEVFAGGTDEEKPEGSYIHLAFGTDDCKHAMECAKKAGAVVTVEPKDVLIDSKPEKTNVRLGFCKGLNGELIEFFEYL